MILASNPMSAEKLESMNAMLEVGILRSHYLRRFHGRMKPRIRKWRDGQWHAQSSSANALGRTPRDAYDRLMAYMKNQHGDA